MGRGLRFVQPDVGQFRVGEQAVGDESAPRGAVAARQVIQHDAAIVFADVGELRTAGGFARRPDVRRGRLQFVVDANIAALVQFDARGGQVEPIGVERAAGRDQDIGGCERLLRLSAANAEDYAVARTALDLAHLGLQQDFDSLVLHQFQNRLRDVAVFAVEQARAALNDGHAAAEPPHGLGEFQTDVAAAENDQVFRQAFKIQGFDVRHRLGGGEARHDWECWLACRR